MIDQEVDHVLLDVKAIVNIGERKETNAEFS